MYLDFITALSEKFKKPKAMPSVANINSFGFIEISILATATSDEFLAKCVRFFMNCK